MTKTEISMKGGGYYSAHTEGAKLTINRAGDMLFQHFNARQVKQCDRPFSIIDYGAADGGTSLEMITRLVNAVRGALPEREMTVTYTDLPHNDFSALFQMLNAEDDDTSNYFQSNRKVYVNCTGTTFYQQVVPDNTVDIAFSATAMHWLSGQPGIISDHVHAVSAKGEQWQNFCDYALNDWNTILLHRARELVAGGLLVMANFCIDEQSRYLGNTGGVNMFDTFWSLWLDMADQGVITHSEAQKTTFPQFYKTIEQFCAPFLSTGSEVSKAGLKLKTAFTGIVKCPYRAQFEIEGNADSFAENYVPTLRSWSERVFFNGLDASRPVDERHRIVNQFYENYKNLVRADPSEHAMDYVHTYMVVQKH